MPSTAWCSCLTRSLISSCSTSHRHRACATAASCCFRRNSPAAHCSSICCLCASSCFSPSFCCCCASNKRSRNCPSTSLVSASEAFFNCCFSDANFPCSLRSRSTSPCNFSNSDPTSAFSRFTSAWSPFACVFACFASALNRSCCASTSSSLCDICCRALATSAAATCISCCKPCTCSSRARFASSASSHCRCTFCKVTFNPSLSAFECCWLHCQSPCSASRARILA
mmetsp:Transcript_68553/g.115242  ORF Transcript_68553/g.115242 Transcript_68553/m.115242 type:complete len:227 (-) Transcript_68553:609-1289(-)